jgi:hypothetical protein
MSGSVWGVKLFRMAEYCDSPLIERGQKQVIKSIMKMKYLDNLGRI